MEDARSLEEKKPCKYKDLMGYQRIDENRKNNEGMEAAGIEPASESSPLKASTMRSS